MKTIPVPFLPILMGLLLLPAVLRAGEPLPTVPNAVQAANLEGEPYASLLAKAWNGDEDALSAMFGYEDKDFFHGAAEQDHLKVLWALCRHLGDRGFSAALEREDPHVAAEVVRAIIPVAGPALKKDFPKTLAFGK